MTETKDDFSSIANNAEFDREYNIALSDEDFKKMYILVRKNKGEALGKILRDTQLICDRKLMVWASHGNWACVNELLTYYPLGVRDISKQVMERLVKNADICKRLRHIFVTLVRNPKYHERVFHDMGHLYWVTQLLSNNVNAKESFVVRETWFTLSTITGLLDILFPWYKGDQSKSFAINSRCNWKGIQVSEEMETSVDLLLHSFVSENSTTRTAILDRVFRKSFTDLHNTSRALRRVFIDSGNRMVTPETPVNSADTQDVITPDEPADISEVVASEKA